MFFNKMKESQKLLKQVIEETNILMKEKGLSDKSKIRLHYSKIRFIKWLSWINKIMLLNKFFMFSIVGLLGLSFGIYITDIISTNGNTHSIPSVIFLANFMPSNQKHDYYVDPYLTAAFIGAVTLIIEKWAIFKKLKVNVSEEMESIKDIVEEEKLHKK